MKHCTMLLILVTSLLQATGAWMFTGRTHPELNWHTIETDHFDVHYHEGIRDIAVQGASIAEQVRPILMEQMGLDTLRRLDIVFTTEDEVLNGFAMPSNHTVIWVDQNDAALWVGDEKWMRTVLAHELQHLVFFNTVKTWLPEPMNAIYAGVPGWIVEGLAEYYTEKWRPFRFDISHKGHVIGNTVHKIQDPHNDGFSKSLYLADRFGDSTIVKILSDRNNAKLLDFKKSFKKHTGVKLKQFNEDWRRHMNTFFFGQRAQKERVEDVGRVHKLPLKRMAAFDYFNDSLRVAMVGQLSKGQGDLSLVVATRDTAKENKEWKKRVEKAEKKGKKPKKVKPKWKIKEFDHGIFGELIQNLDVAPDGESIIYPKYRFGQHQSLQFGIWKLDIESKKKTLLTPHMRANYPQYSPDGSKIVFVAHENSTTQLYTMNADGSDIKPLTMNEGDTQIITPMWRPDGKAVAFAQSDPDGLMDLHIMDLATGRVSQITDSHEGDYAPIWHPDGKKISYTGLYDYTPNLYTHDLESGETIQNTDIGDVVIGASWNYETSAITALTLRTTDSSRVVDIDPSRLADKREVKMNPAFSSWRTKAPDHPMENINSKLDVKIHSETPYKFYKHISHVGSVVLPDFQSLFLETAFTDGMGRHVLGGLIIASVPDSLFGTLIQYNNNTGFPFGGSWGVNYYKDLFFTFQFYNRDQVPLLELFNGTSLWWMMPYNFGNSRAANHSIGIALGLMDRQALDFEDSLDVFSPPESGKEGMLSLNYTFKNQRIHRRNMFAPNHGYGFSVNHDMVTSAIWGDLDYNKTEIDLFTHQKAGPLSFYARGRYEKLSGIPLAQDTLGIFDIPNYYIAGSFVPGREYMSPRGFSDSLRYGDQAFMGTIELRAPAAPFQFVEILKIIQLGNPTVALISDFGNAWNNDEEKDDLIMTTGLEFRFALSLAKSPLFIFSYGWAQENNKWSDGSPDPYFQMTLINPF
jgi:WD40 repeat protein